MTQKSWLTRAFVQETESVLTRALQKSLFDNLSKALVSVTKTVDTTVSAASRSGSEPDMPTVKRRNVTASGRITKRKSRASKKNLTTFITADPANSRHMVQQVTGVKFGN